jgi:ubiquinone/menaquinone biosynthesis C-methylase UbiE
MSNSQRAGGRSDVESVTNPPNNHVETNCSTMKSSGTKELVKKRKSTRQAQLESWYDHPEWFEIGFEKDTVREADFFEKAFERWCPFQVNRFFEPACGSGRIVVEMAKRGYEVGGFDLSEPSLEYLRNRLRREKLKGEVFKADMSNFQIKGKWDAASCTFNSIRHLTTEEQAHGQLECVAKALRSGGLYFLGLHLAPPDCEPLCVEKWIGERGNTRVTTTLRVTQSSRKTRLERLRISVLVREFAKSSNRKLSNGKHANGKMANGKPDQYAAKPRLSGPSEIVGRMVDEFDYRMYTAAQIRSLIASVPELEILDTFDFWYDINDSQKLDNEAIDVLFVLRKR